MILEGKVALVTGAASGIGRATARLLVREGARVGALDHSEPKLRNLVAEIGPGGEVLPVVADISQADQVRRAVDRVAEAFGRLDVVVANAGINGVRTPIASLEPEEWDRVLAVNLRGTFLTLKHAVPHLSGRGGSVIVMSSINGTRTFSLAGASAYAASKAGQVALAKMAALELAKHRVRVNVICPGAIESDIEQSTERRDAAEAAEPVTFPEGKIPLTDGRLGTADQVARVVLFLASDASDHITGTELFIDGAESLMGETGLSEET